MGKANDQLDALAEDFAKQHNVSFYDAYATVADQNPALYKAAVDEPADLATLSKGTTPAQRQHADEQMQKATAIEAQASPSEAEKRLDELAKARAAKDATDYYTAYDAVAQEQPELYAKAVNGSASLRIEQDYLKMLETRVGELRAAEDESEAERLESDVDAIRRAITSRAFDATPKLLDELRKFDEELAKRSRPAELTKDQRETLHDAVYGLSANEAVTDETYELVEKATLDYQTAKVEDFTKAAQALRSDLGDGADGDAVVKWLEERAQG